MKSSKILLLLIASSLSFSLMAKSLTLGPIEGEVFNHTQNQVSKANLNIELRCVQGNMVVGTETLSTDRSEQTLRLKKNERSTQFLTKSLSTSCSSFSMWKRWMTVTISVAFPEINSSLYKTFNRRSEQYSASELKELVEDYLQNIQVPEANN